MPSDEKPELSLFLEILRALERIGAPYMVIGGFAATLYGSTRATYDIDMVVDLDERHILALAESYPPPRYYADPEQMRDSIRRGIPFNIIDGSRGEKADLSPLTRDSRYRHAFGRRIRQRIEWPGVPPFDAWCARPDDVIYGKFLAWQEGRSRKHPADIHSMLVLLYSGADPDLAAYYDEAYLDVHAEALGPEVAGMWEAAKAAARREAQRGR